MLRMDGFEVHAARTAEEAVALYGSHEGAHYVAGGTDLVPNLKHRIVPARHLVSLSTALPRGWRKEDGSWIIGAGTRLSELARMTELKPLAEAAGLVAGPQIRNMGTIGGNILLDTRCLFFNQTLFWRKALGYCLKAEGTWCHVVGGPKTCVATQSSDTVPVLLALGARIRLLGPNGSRELDLRSLYKFNGMDHLQIEEGELLTAVVVPDPGTGFRGSYTKLRMRGAIDFPQLGVAIAGTFAGDVPTKLEIVVGAINPQPKPVRGLDAFVGKPLDDESVQAIGEIVHQQTRPQGSVQGDTTWRRRMARVYVERGLRSLRSA
jgi:4-hydroxybenzoyl-CoA reductase subunit beta